MRDVGAVGDFRAVRCGVNRISRLIRIIRIRISRISLRVIKV